MAASSSSSDTRKYDVFLSFRGEDTRKNFVCHLYRALEQKAIYTFIDSEELDKGNKILELLDAIEDSRLSIVVLSENYASSSWCLKELVKILECQYTNNQIVVPIFYHVDPSNIRKLKRKFGEAFAKHGENSTAQSWRSALTRVADLSGWDSTKYEDDGKLIEEIVEDTFKKLIYISSSKAIGLVGMDSHIKEMSLRLFRGVNDVRVVGIWGMGGIGKTTIARAVYDQIAWQFEHSCFLDNVKEAFINKREAQMQEELLSRLLKEKVQSVGLNRGRNMIMERLGKKEVLVVLDDVENSAQIEALLGNLYSFGVGSRIIITSRDKQSLSGVDELYEPNHLSRYEAHELFMKYAFGKNQPHRGLQSSLMACHKLCSRGKNYYFVTEVLDSCGFFPESGLSVLVDRALITISDYDQLDMHDLLQEMGREMVRQDPGGRSRLWSYEDVDRLLTPNTATEAVECIIIDLSNSKIDICIDTGAFVRMRKLRLLMIYYSFYSICDDCYDFLGCEAICPSDGCKQHGMGDFEFLSQELRFLIWHGCPLKSLPSNFNPKFLVRLDMRGSHIQQLWEGIMPLKKLKVILLNYCKYLVKTPDLTEVTNLETLVLDGCSSLIEVHPSISSLQNLLILSLKGDCRELNTLPSSIHMKSLRTLDLSGCSNLEKFPEISEVMKELSELCLNESGIKELPSSINNLTGLRTLNLRDCRELNNLSSSIYMKSLEILDLCGCSKLRTFQRFHKKW
ncbi:hypothetical protein M0R45_025551 [Rubus argutus]|uniref:TIR domain-containing protein n=1 Tax=Rubus argutus TaxID=59490 RepID=A0AAW1WW95_RUBAR